MPGIVICAWFALATVLVWGLVFFQHDLLPEGYATDWIRDIGLFLAGVGIAPLGLWLANRRTNNESARRITDAFTKAVELLGHENIAVRQGGIYALGRLASESKNEHPQIMDIIAAYVRNGSALHIAREIEKRQNIPPKPENNTLEEESAWVQIVSMQEENIKENIVSRLPMPVDLEAAISVVRERCVEFDRKPTTRGGHIFDLSNVFLFNANFGQTSLARVNLSDCDFRSCLFERTSLAHANLVGSNFKGSDLVGSNFKGSNLKGAKFNNANISDANFEGANLVNSNFEGSNLKGAKFNNANIRAADLRKALNLTQAQIDSAKAGTSDENFLLLPKGLSPPKKDGGK